jgi:Flp pilus assembly protein TadG
LKPRRDEQESGAAMVEFAIVLPLLMLILFGIIEFGVVLYNKAVLTNASREGARAGIVYVNYTSSPSQANAGAAVSNYLSKAPIISLTGAAPSITPAVTGTCNAQGAQLTVNLSYTHSFLVLSNLSFFGALPATVVLTGETVMRCE